MNEVTVIFNTNKPTQLTLEWISDSVSDMIADSIVSLTMQLDQK